MNFYLNGTKMGPSVFAWLVLVIGFCVYTVLVQRASLEASVASSGHVLEDVYVTMDKEFAYIQVIPMDGGIAIKELLKHKYLTLGEDQVLVVKAPVHLWDLSMGYFDLFALDNADSLVVHRKSEVGYITFLQDIKRSASALRVGGLTIYDYMVVLSFLFFVFISVLRGRVGTPLLIMFSYWGVSAYLSELIPYWVDSYIHASMISSYFT